jgi:hypothetical protein
MFKFRLINKQIWAGFNYVVHIWMDLFTKESNLK